MRDLKEYIIEQLITEHFVTCTSKEEMKRYAKEVYDMLQECYKYIGGIAGINSADELIENTDFWKLVRRGGSQTSTGKITAAKLYKVKDGMRKCNCAGFDGTEQGKKDLLKIYQEDAMLKDRKVYGEFSGKAVSTVLKQGGIPVPNVIAQQMLSDKEVELMDDGWYYKRELGDGKKHIKLMAGNLPGKSYNEEKPSDELVTQLKDLAKKYFEEEHKEEHTNESAEVSEAMLLKKGKSKIISNETTIKTLTKLLEENKYKFTVKDNVIEINNFGTITVLNRKENKEDYTPNSTYCFKIESKKYEYNGKLECTNAGRGNVMNDIINILNDKMRG